jgi:ubiquinone/menaquinone biosynthesis C-methylase UbiE
MEEKPEPIESIRSLFNEISPHFDSWVNTLQGKVYGYITWEHLKQYLPLDKNSLILDAGGGTGRWSVPLAKMGYKVILCDISQGMLQQAENKILKEGLSDKVKIQEEDLTCLSFADQTYDFVLCEDGPISISDSQKVVRELVRVLKKKGKIWASVLGRYPLAFAEVRTDPEKALKMCKSKLNYTPYKGIQRSRIFNPHEIQSLFQQSGIKVNKVYGNLIAVRVLPDEMQTTANFDDTFFSQLSAMELYLSEVPSLSGMAEYLQIVGEKLSI